MSGKHIENVRIYLDVFTECYMSALHQTFVQKKTLIDVMFGLDYAGYFM